MEQVKLFESTSLNDLEGIINRFMSDLNEHVDIVDVRIDTHSNDTNNMTVFNVPKLICTIRFATYNMEDQAPVDSDPTADLVNAMNNGYPINDNHTDYAMEPLNHE